MLKWIEEFGHSDSRILTGVGIIATVAQALTIFDAIADFGPAMVDVFNGLSFLAQAVRDAGLGLVVALLVDRYLHPSNRAEPAPTIPREFRL